MLIMASFAITSPLSFDTMLQYPRMDLHLVKRDSLLGVENKKLFGGEAILISIRLQNAQEN